MEKQTHQRAGSKSNTHVGMQFEAKARCVLRKHLKLRLNKQFALPIGVHADSQRHHPHVFDLGSERLKVIVECKSHRWTSGSNVPSAKIINWNQAMFYFSLVPQGWKKLFIAVRHIDHIRGKSLMQYYREHNHHLIPDDVELWEFNEETGELEMFMKK